MKDFITIPDNQEPAIEEPKTDPAVPAIETPEPPQIKDPSMPREIEKEKSPTNPGKRKRKPIRTSSQD